MAQLQNCNVAEQKEIRKAEKQSEKKSCAFCEVDLLFSSQIFFVYCTLKCEHVFSI